MQLPALIMDTVMVRNAEVERIAETHFGLRPLLLRVMEGQLISEEMQGQLPVRAANYREYWEGTYSDRWFDMATIMRLGTAIETGLRDSFYRVAPAGERVDRGLFQRLVTPGEIEIAFQTKCSVDLSAIPQWITMRQIMVHRHLFAHRGGLVDDDYLAQHSMVCGVDIRADVELLGYPEKDVFWFRPLKDIPYYIEAARAFFGQVP